MWRDKTILGITIAAIIVVAVSFFLPSWLLNQALFGFARALAVIGLMVLWRTGLVSFGHALYFGGGAYAAALLSRYYEVSDFFVLLLAGIVATTIVGFVLGFIIRRYRDIFFAMLSLAFSMILYGVLVKTEALGSTDGFAVSSPTFLFYAPEPGDEAKQALFVALVIAGWLAAVLVQMYLNSTLGRLTTARPERQFINSKGMNLVTRQVFAEFGAAIPYQEEYKDKQAVFDKGKLHFFICPWRRYSIIGTRHLPWDGDPDEFRVTQADVDKFLDEVNRAYPPAQLKRSDVVRVYEGILPALAGEDGKDDVQIGKQYRITDHAQRDGVEGLVSMVGVKWTTARDVGAKAIEAVLAKLGRGATADSAKVRLPGGEIGDWNFEVGALTREIAEGYEKLVRT